MFHKENNIKSKLKELNLEYSIKLINKKYNKNINILKMYKYTYIKKNICHQQNIIIYLKIFC